VVDSNGANGERSKVGMLAAGDKAKYGKSEELGSRGKVPHKIRIKINWRISKNGSHGGRDEGKMLATGKSLVFPELHMTGDTKATRFGIIAKKTLLRDIIAKKTTQPRPRFEFISFMGKKKDKANTIKYSKKGIVWEFVIK
jgi:hypothetical protein